MEKLWVLVIVAGAHNTVHALGGPWTSEKLCWNYVALLNKGTERTGEEYMGQCVTWKEYRKRWPNLELETQT